MKPSTIYQVLACSLLFIGLNSCKKYVEIPAPDNQLVASLAFADVNTANATLAGVYSSMNAFNNSFANYVANFMPAMSADEFHYGLSTASLNDFKDDNISTNNTYVGRIWNSCYEYIYQVNAILEGLAASNTLSEEAKAPFIGEAKFLRAFCYFYLVNFYGDVPLILSTDYKVNTSLPRTDKAVVYDSILADLVDAQSLLNDDYPSGERIRANKAAATALLARTYLYLGQWDKAEAEATKVINDPLYHLLDDLNAVFLKNSEEAILQLQSVNTSTAGVNTWEGFSIVPASPTGRSYYQVYDGLYTAFESGDLRKDSWLRGYLVSGITYYCPNKYKIRTKETVEEYSMVIRFAEMFLIRAEARAHQDNPDGAREDIDTIRGRAGLEDLDENISGDDLLLAIEQERRIELFAEWGHRWFDLRRTGRSLEVLSPIKPDLTENDLYYPIALDAMRTNPNLEQNPGYN